MPEETSGSSVSEAPATSEASSSSASSSSTSQKPSQRFGETQGASARRAEAGANGTGQDVSSVHETNGKTEKPKSRYQRTIEWRKSIEERERRVAEAERRVAERSQPQEPKVSLAELKQYRKAWAQEAEYDPDKQNLVAQADAEIARMEGKQGFESQWHAAEAEIRKEDPDFGIEGTPVDRKIRELLASPAGQHYRAYPLGIVAAYDKAKELLLREAHQELQTRYSKSEDERKRLMGLTAIDSGAPGQVGSASGGEMSEANFRKLSLDQMRERLRRDAARTSRR